MTDKAFATVDLGAANNYRLSELPEGVLSRKAHELKTCFLRGEQTLWGLPFRCGDGDGAGDDLLIVDAPVRVAIQSGARLRWLLFLHASDYPEERRRKDGLFARPFRGSTGLGEHVCDYAIEYEDGSSIRVPIRRRLEISQPGVSMGESSFVCVPHAMPRPGEHTSELLRAGGTPTSPWGESQGRVTADYGYPFAYHWIYAMENPYPDKRIAALSLVPGEGKAIVFAITASSEEEHPLRMLPRAKLALEGLAGNEPPMLNIDRGRVISVRPSADYSEDEWKGELALAPPSGRGARWIVEYAAHPNARMYGLPNAEGGVCVGALARREGVSVIPQRERNATVTITGGEGTRMPARVHFHGEYGEPLTTTHRPRHPNGEWFEDYGTDCLERGHWTTYHDGRADYKFPLGAVYAEVTRGFEYVPVRRKIEIGEETDAVEIALERGLDWRSKGWVTADTHVHFLAPTTALLQGKAEDVHMVHVLASQWGELFSNVGDFDGETTVGAGDGGKGHYLARVGTENRQAVLGHLSLLGYEGDMILPLCTGGPMESAIGDPLEATMLTWAAKGREQEALVVLPHFPSPRGEEAAVYLSGLADAIEICSWSDGHGGISAHALSDWYRYLNCGRALPVVGGTDKMSAGEAVGRVRTYSRLRSGGGGPFSLEDWKASVRGGETFATAGPLMEFSVDGKPMGSSIDMPAGGAELEIRWEAASVTMPMTAVELVSGGETIARETFERPLCSYAGSWRVRVEDPTWLALRIRGYRAGGQETIAAHGTPIMATVDGRTPFNAADAATIVDQIEGALRFFETLATRPALAEYERMREAIAEAGRMLANPERRANTR